MNRSGVFFILSLFLVVVAACNKPQNNVPEVSEEIVIVRNSQDLTIRAHAMADSLLASLTLEQRVGQCLMPALPASAEMKNLRLLQDYISRFHIGGIMLLNGDKESVGILSQEAQISNIPLFISIDAEWGLGMRLRNAKKYIKNGLINDTTPESHLFDYGRIIGQECIELGINMVLGPVLDVSAPHKGYIGLRAYSDNPEKVSAFGIAYAKGLESQGVISVAKHFPGHGHTQEDSHQRLAVITGSYEKLDSVELLPFKNFISSGLSALLVGHLQSLVLDSTGTPASVSHTIITDLLRKKLGFEGLIITDAFNMHGIDGYSPTDALLAGADIILFPDNAEETFQTILNNINTGILPVSILNERCRRILFIKALYFI